ncbi:hypothetical protein ACJX0J_040053 [Zea mays]
MAQNSLAQFMWKTISSMKIEEIDHALRGCLKFGILYYPLQYGQNQYYACSLDDGVGLILTIYGQYIYVVHSLFCKNSENLAIKIYHETQKITLIWLCGTFNIAGVTVAFIQVGRHIVAKQEIKNVIPGIEEIDHALRGSLKFGMFLILSFGTCMNW